MNSATRFRSSILGTMMPGALTLAVLSAVLVSAALPAHSQTESVLHSFCTDQNHCPDGDKPTSTLTPDGAGNLYGTTPGGGVFGPGVVFELSPNGGGGWNETVIYSFHDFPDADSPEFSKLLFDSAGNIYGTTLSGGDYISGAVFELSPAGGSWTESVLYSFGGYKGDGTSPVNGLIMDAAGNLYGKTLQGGAQLPEGSVFELSPSAGGWTEKIIYNTGEAGGGSTDAGLTMDSAGNIYGVTATAIFELSPNGNGGWNPSVIYHFANRIASNKVVSGGNVPQGTLVFDKAGNLYGTTYSGGADDYGTVFELSPGNKGEWTKRILYSFQGGSQDGEAPVAGVVLDPAGNIYGTTTEGGANEAGVLFELLAPEGQGSYQEKILWTFSDGGGAGTGGGLPFGGLILDSAGNLYGTTYYGGEYGCGVAFELTP
jgi:uncharacterized repeat protein (TIGR03803 family)